MPSPTVAAAVAALPITERSDEVVAALRDHQVVVVAGETGSGKSTQLPKLCLVAGRGREGRLIGHTQPRRLAARTVAERIADELDTTVGGSVGYAIRFTDRVGPDTRIKVMTDGILLAELQRDRELRAYDTIIVDEAHERSLNVDFLLGYLKQLLPRRPDLHVVVTSATIDTARFARHFDDAPIIEVSGRTYPVEVRYRPVVEDSDDTGRDQLQGIIDAIAELDEEAPGDVLVFLSGEREIRDTADALRALDLRHTEVLPLYARLSAAEQHRVFAPHTGRRIVLATNVAETSLTVPGVRYVVDPGTARISRFNRRTKMQRLPIEPVSQASADQRAGRCGRVAPGVCIRLYAEDDFLGRPEFTEPEILRTNLASVILQMKALRIGEIESFPFLEPPDRRSITDGLNLLDELNALDGSRLTPIGRRLARLPIDPRFGRMVLEAERNGCVHDVLVIAAGLSIQDPRERPMEHRAAADESHARFADPASDFVAFLNLWDHLTDLRRHLSSNQFRRRCKAEYLHHLRVREWQDVYSQLLSVSRGMGMRVNRQRADPDSVHRSLLAGLLSHVGMRDDERRVYRGARELRFSLSPASILAAKPPKWVMAAEVVETTRSWAHVAARIQPEWAERVGAHLVKRTHGDPEWNRQRATATAHERVTLYGLPLVVDRRVDFGRIDPEWARDIFIRAALVDGDWDTHHAFAAHNRGLVDEVHRLEDRVRRRNLLVDDESIARFFDARVPHDMTSGARFDRWWNRTRSDDPHLLDLSLERLLDPDAGAVDPDEFPGRWRHGEVEFPLSYMFDPYADDDGVTVHIPLDSFRRAAGAGFDWHVTGHRVTLLSALIRSLPRPLRRHFVPAAEYAADLAQRVGPDDGPLLAVVSGALARASGEPVGLDEATLAVLPPYLRVTIRVHDARGRTLASGKDLATVERHLEPARRAALARATEGVRVRGLTSWTIGTLPRTIEVPWAGGVERAYATLVDEGEAAAVDIAWSAAEQTRRMAEGTRRMILLTSPSPTAVLRKRLSNETKLGLAHAPHASYAELLDDCVRAATDSLIGRHGGPAWDADGFETLRAVVAAELSDQLVGVVAAAGRVLGAAHALELRLDAMASPRLVTSMADVRVQLRRLVHPGFVTETGARRLPDAVRYLRAVGHRLDRLPDDVPRDLALTRRVHALEDLAAALRPDDARRIGWMLEELRVSLFAQHLGTAVRVSDERVRRAIAEAGGS